MVIIMSNIHKKFTILLLSAPIGAGHRLAAEGLQEYLQKNPQVEVIHGNIFDFFPHCLGQGFLKAYLWILGHCPWLYELAYKWGNQERGSLWMRNLINGLLALLGKSYLRQIQPDAVLATHATPVGIMSIYKKKYQPHLYLGAVITDFTIHRWWICPRVNTYFLADAALQQLLPQEATSLATGIPLRQAFTQYTREQVRQEYQWQEQEKICLLMGGGEGLLPMEEIIAALLQLQHSQLKLVVITGNNEELAQQLRQEYGPTIAVYGFIDFVPKLMLGADMLISKAGGLTAAEAHATGLELFIYKPLPGQESKNASFLAANYGAHIVNSPQEIKEGVGQLLTTAGPGEKSRQAQEAKKHAAASICKQVLKELDEQSFT